MGKLTRYLGAAVLIALLTHLQTESALAVPFNIGCGAQANIDTNPPTLVACSVGSLGTISDLTVSLEIDDPGGFPYVSDLEIILINDSTGISVVLYTGSRRRLPKRTWTPHSMTRPRASLLPRVMWSEPTCP